MNPHLQSVQTALDETSKISEHREKLATEQRELQDKIKTLTNVVASGDDKSVNALTIAKSRAEVLPSELSSVQHAFDGAVESLRATLPPLSPMVAKVYGAEFQRVQTAVSAFLKTHLDEPFLVEEHTRQITNNAKTVRALDFLNMRFSALNLTRLTDANSVISRARDAITLLKNI
jgi:hypothetical protein